MLQGCIQATGGWQYGFLQYGSSQSQRVNGPTALASQSFQQISPSASHTDIHQKLSLHNSTAHTQAHSEDREIKKADSKGDEKDEQEEASLSGLFNLCPKESLEYAVEMSFTMKSSDRRCYYRATKDDWQLGWEVGQLPVELNSNKNKNKQ